MTSGSEATLLVIVKLMIVFVLEEKQDLIEAHQRRKWGLVDFELSGQASTYV